MYLFSMKDGYIVGAHTPTTVLHLILLNRYCLLHDFCWLRGLYWLANFSAFFSFGKVIRELSGLILTRGPKLCNFVEWRGYKVVYRRYASLYFCMCIDADDNELEVLEIIHHFVEILDRYFGSVCELDLIFNFHKAYYVLDEILISGELQESSKKNVARLIAAQDSLVEAAKEEAGSISNIIAQATK
ncbi:hypothetical protein VPH35_092855 [Triticum aestivum]